MILKTARQAQIRTLVNESGSITVSELIDLLGVSEATVRRDLDELDGQGTVLRTHGGAMRALRVGREPPLLDRHGVMAKEKASIAARAAQLVRPGDTVFLGSGTTVSLMAALLAGVENLKLISNSLPVINTLTGLDNIELHVIGGTFRDSELSMVGPVAVDAIRSFRADHVFMGMRAIDVNLGFTGDAVDEAMTDRAILEIGSHSVVLADHKKFGGVSTVFLAPIQSADLIITDSGVEPTLVESISSAGTHVIIAESDGG